MDVKTLIVKADTNHFEKRVKEYLEQGYKLLQSNITTIGTTNTAIIKPTNVGYTGNMLTFYYYALFIKE